MSGRMTSPVGGPLYCNYIKGSELGLTWSYDVAASGQEPSQLHINANGQNMTSVRAQCKETIFLIRQMHSLHGSHQPPPPPPRHTHTLISDQTLYTFLPFLPFLMQSLRHKLQLAGHNVGGWRGLLLDPPTFYVLFSSVNYVALHLLQRHPLTFSIGGGAIIFNICGDITLF